MIERPGWRWDRSYKFHPDLTRRSTVGPRFLALIDRKGLPRFARDRVIFAVDFDHELVGTIKARERCGISIKLLR
jgi:hypothetical protein